MEFNEFLPSDIDVLTAMYLSTDNGRLDKRITKTTVFKHLPIEYNHPRRMRNANKSFEKLIAKGFIIKHPSKGNPTYNISRDGVKIVKENFPT